MSDTALDTICINGTSPPYKRPAWVIGQVGSEELQRRAHTAPGRERQTREPAENRRPKSTPSRLNVSFLDSPRMRCSRWRQVNSARHRNSLDKDHDDGMTIMLSSGYILSRNKEKINVTIKTDNFFKEGGMQAKARKTSQRLDEKDIVIHQLRQQIDDLTVLLEEERLNHKINVKQVEESHQLYIEEIHEKHREHVKSVEDDHNDDVEKLKNSFQQQLEEERETADAERARLQGEIESLQGAFEAYKEIVAAEMDYKWQRRVKELRDEHEQHTEDQLTKQRRDLLHEQNKEIEALNKEFQRQIQILVEDHRKEVDNLMEKFAECVQDSEQLKSALLEMQTLKQRKDELEENLKTKTQVLRKTQMELEDKAIKLAGFEKHFAEKVEEVDNRYSMRMQGLMSDNTALRRHCITKCEQLFKLKSEKETEQENTVRTARDALQAIILTRAKCDVSLTALRHEVPDVRKTRQGMRKDRPTSAPGTREEFATAEQSSSAITQSPLTPTSLPDHKSRTSDPRPHTSHGGALYKRRTPTETARGSGSRGSLVPTHVNVSNQGIQNLRVQSEYQDDLSASYSWPVRILWSC